MYAIRSYYAACRLPKRLICYFLLSTLFSPRSPHLSVITSYSIHYTKLYEKASADIYSLIETAKANKLEPYHYLRYLFEKLPFAESQEEYEALLPMRLKPEDLFLGNTASGV